MARPKASEFRNIELIERVLGARATGREIELGIGDDAALVRLGREKLVLSVDAQVEGVHFDRRWMSLADIGYRSFQAALSDLAAMGAEPLAALSNLSFPRKLGQKGLASLVSGQGQASAEGRCPLVGGNLTRASELSITTTVIGRARRPLLRSGARPGHELWLVGDIGLARAGLLLLSQRVRESAGLSACFAKFRRPEALVTAGLELVGHARAAIDLSDGLAGDAGHLARASGVRLVLDAEQLEARLSDSLRLACRRLGLRALDVALQGGEDYALLCAGPARSRPRCATPIGRVESGRGVFIAGPRGLKKLGGSFDHFG